MTTGLSKNLWEVGNRGTLTISTVEGHYIIKPFDNNRRRSTLMKSPKIATGAAGPPWSLWSLCRIRVTGGSRRLRGPYGGHLQRQQRQQQQPQLQHGEQQDTGGDQLKPQRQRGHGGILQLLLGILDRPRIFWRWFDLNWFQTLVETCDYLKTNHYNNAILVVPTFDNIYNHNNYNKATPELPGGDYRGCREKKWSRWRQVQQYLRSKAELFFTRQPGPAQVQAAQSPRQTPAGLGSYWEWFCDSREPLSKRPTWSHWSKSLRSILV